MIREPAVEQCCQMRVREHLVQQIAERVGRALERMGLLQRDAESAWLDLPPVKDTDASSTRA